MVQNIGGTGATVVTHILAREARGPSSTSAHPPRRRPDEPRRHGPPERPHDADGLAARMGDVICGAQERIRGGETAGKLLVLPHEQQRRVAPLAMLNASLPRR
jgi:hypothetical protein